MNVLFVVSECVPFVKSGGLADVAGSLPNELIKQGTDVRVILPKYGTIHLQYKKEMNPVKQFDVKVGWRKQYCGIEQLVLKNITYYFVDNEYYFNRENLYGYDDDGERFAYFNQAVLESLGHIDFLPDIIHCHDWHTAMIPYLLRIKYQHRQGYQHIKSVFTIHNLQFQGIFAKEAAGDLFELDYKHFNSKELEFYGAMNFMKGGLVAADSITTVSEAYKEEIQTEYYGEKLHGLLKQRANHLEGILNGIDDEFYNPASDPALKQSFHVSNRRGKKENKLDLQQKFGLEEDIEIPIIAMVTRLTKQKGLDLITCIFHELMQEDIQFILLGTGDEPFEQFFRAMEQKYPQKCKAYIGFDESIAHRIYAGADLFLMPSQFEPCGLGQMIAMRYGAVPIVRETGGLKDTVLSYDPETRKGNGFTFTNFNAHDMLYTIRRALDFFQNENDMDQVMTNAMKKDFSWAQSAFQYNRLYASLITRSETHVF